MLPSDFHPLLAVKYNPDKVRFPVVATPKLDGFRCHSFDGLYSRKLLRIPNRFVNEALAHVPPFIDGELMTKTGFMPDDFDTVNSKLSAHDGTPDVVFHAFDYMEHPTIPYIERLELLRERIAGLVRVVYVQAYTIHDMEQLHAFHLHNVKEGHEGTMIRDPGGRYKYGRSTINEGILLKVKDFTDDEAAIVGYEEMLQNTNAPTLDNLGKMKRSSHKAGMVPMGTLGALKGLWKGVTFSCGTGLDDATRARLWSIRDTLKGQRFTFSFQGVGANGKPRFPSYRGIRLD